MKDKRGSSLLWMMLGRKRNGYQERGLVYAFMALSLFIYFFELLSD